MVCKRTDRSSVSTLPTSGHRMGVAAHHSLDAATLRFIGDFGRSHRMLWDRRPLPSRPSRPEAPSTGRSGLPTPRRRTFAAGILPFAHSDADIAPQSLLRLSAYAGSRGMGNPDQTAARKCLKPPQLQGTQRAKPAPRASRVAPHRRESAQTRLPSHRGRTPSAARMAAGGRRAAKPAGAMDGPAGAEVRTSDCLLQIPRGSRRHETAGRPGGRASGETCRGIWLPIDRRQGWRSWLERRSRRFAF